MVSKLSKITVMQTFPTHDTPIARLMRGVFSNYGFCLRCGRPWNFVKEHVTQHTLTEGCFPLCKMCWVILEVPEARIEYYKALIDEWELKGSRVSDETKRTIKRAVANGG